MNSRVESPRCLKCRRARPARPPAPALRWACDYCGAERIRPPTRGQPPKYCTKQCQQNATFARRRARMADAFVEDVPRYEVFARDGFRCQLCRRKCDRTKVVPHRRAPTVDHIVPIAKGGKHERANCQTACFSCNSAKQDRGGGEQFALVI